MPARHTRRLLSSALGLIVLAALWLCFAPTAIGGSTTYVVTDGVSMQPRFHSGDLALVRSQSSYHVGEIVAYHSRLLHTIVLHRIIARAGDRYVFKGDNNNFVDYEHPTRSQLIGSLWMHLPGVGAPLRSIRSPALVGILLATGVLLFAGAAFERRRRRRRRSRAQRAQQSAPSPRGRPRERSAQPLAGTLALGLLALAPFVALALLAFTRAPTARLPYQLPYRQSGKLTYSARATPGPAYPDDRAVTGQPLFTHVVSAMRLRFAYRFHAAPAHSLAGTASLHATVSSTSGWQTTLALGRPTYFHGDRAHVSATLDVSSLLALVHRVENATATSGSYTLAIVPRVRVGGSVEALPLRTTFSPRIQFSLSSLEIQPAVASASGSLAAGAAARASASQFAPSASGAVTGTRYQPLYLSFKLVRLTVAAARAIALGGIATIVCVLLAALAFARPRLRDESTAIRTRYGRMIVPVERVWQLPGIPVIDVGDIDALARIAEHYDRSILHEVGEEGDAFWVSDESGQFRYVVGATPPAGEQAAIDAPDELSTLDPVGGQASALARAPVETPAEPPWASAEEPVTATWDVVPAQEQWTAQEATPAPAQEQWPTHEREERAALTAMPAQQRRAANEEWPARDPWPAQDPAPGEAEAPTETFVGAFARFSGPAWTVGG